MEIGIRFSCPLPEKTDLEKLNEQFLDSSKKVEEVLKNAPYEISVLACLIERIADRLDGSINEL